jgi:hypothetical protein
MPHKDCEGECLKHAKLYAQTTTHVNVPKDAKLNAQQIKLAKVNAQLKPAKVNG